MRLGVRAASDLLRGRVGGDQLSDLFEVLRLGQLDPELTGDAGVGPPLERLVFRLLLLRPVAQGPYTGCPSPPASRKAFTSSAFGAVEISASPRRPASSAAAGVDAATAIGGEVSEKV